jgi:antitoxin component YwqK of YwqJK toxin-antitoxin module
MKLNQYNEEGQRHGYWEYYYYHGTILSKGNYDNGQPYGYWEYYWGNGELKEQIFYS